MFPFLSDNNQRRSSLASQQRPGPILRRRKEEGLLDHVFTIYFALAASSMIGRICDIYVYLQRPKEQRALETAQEAQGQWGRNGNQNLLGSLARSPWHTALCRTMTVNSGVRNICNGSFADCILDNLILLYETFERYALCVYSVLRDVLSDGSCLWTHLLHLVVMTRLRRSAGGSTLQFRGSPPSLRGQRLEPQSTFHTKQAHLLTDTTTFLNQHPIYIFLRHLSVYL